MKLAEMLAKLDGGIARFVSYDELRTAQVMVIIGEREFEIVFYECSYVALPTSWRIGSLVCAPIGGNVCVRDDVASMMVVCCRLGCFELGDDGESIGDPGELVDVRRLDDDIA